MALKHARDLAFSVCFLTSLYDVAQNGVLSIEWLSDIYKNVLGQMVVILDFDNAISKPQKQSIISLLYPTILPPVKKRTLGPGDMATLVKQCYTLKISPATLFQQITRHVPRSKDPASLFHVLIIPFLKELVQYSESNETPTDGSNSEYPQFIGDILGLYTSLYVGQEPHLSPDWAYPMITTCVCRDCGSLNRFMTDARSQIGRFPVATARRAHLHKACDGNKSLTHETERQGSPYTLVVTKTHSYNQMWRDRANKALSNIGNIAPQSTMEAILGTNGHRSIMKLECVRVNNRQTTTLSSNAPTPGAFGQKRPAEMMNGGDESANGSGRRMKITDIIDLT